MDKLKDNIKSIDFKYIDVSSDESSSDAEEWDIKRKKSGMKKIKNLKLPNKLIPPPSKGDKSFAESWVDEKKKGDILNFPCPLRCVLSGPPSSGKTYNIYNILLRQDPPFEKVYLLHFDETSKDYTGIHFENTFTEIPNPLHWKDDKQSKKCLIIEDLCFTNLNKIEKKRLNRLFGYTASHCNLSLLITSQNFLDIGPDLRRQSNLIITFKQPDLNALVIMSKRCGMQKDDFMKIFDKYLRRTHTALYIDLQNDTKARYRIDGFRPIRKNENGEWVEYDV